MALPLLAEAADQHQAEEEDHHSPEDFVRAGYAQLQDAGLSEDSAADTVDLDVVMTAANGGNFVSINGIEVHVYGDFCGSQMCGTNAENNLNKLDSDEEEADDEQRVQAETAIRKAKEADEARRSAPLPPERCRAIRDAMQRISIGGFRPDWADRVSEDDWVGALKNKSTQVSGQGSSALF